MGAPVAELVTYEPIGTFVSALKYPAEAGHQPDSNHPLAHVELFSGRNFEQALKGLEHFSHIWIVFQFHHNKDWKPLVTTPRGGTEKYGVFATRAPYRPNNIGMSLVKLARIEGLKIFVEGADILDGSPILDIKPYLVDVECVPDASSGWPRSQSYQIDISQTCEEQLRWLEEKGLQGLRSFLLHQLEYEPTNHKKKRLEQREDESFVIAYRTWRVHFSVMGDTVYLLNIFSGYTQAELNDPTDLYKDKDLHRLFMSTKD